MTFSFGNRVLRNRFVENAICGIWGGYSQDTLVAENHFEGNGGMAYGLERGGVNIEHGAGNIVVSNRFLNNKVGVHLWWDGQGDFESKTWGKVNYKGILGNVIAGNTFEINPEHPFKNLRPGDLLIGSQLRQDAPDKFKSTVYAKNDVKIDPAVGKELDVAPGITYDTQAAVPTFDVPEYQTLGKKRPVGARPNFRGRDKIIMDEWGPWDHESPFIRPRSKAGGEHLYEVFGGGCRISDASSNPGVTLTLEHGKNGGPTLIRAKGEPGVHAYKTRVTFGGQTTTLSGSLIAAEWALSWFTWTKDTDPREKLDAWRALASSEQAGHVTVDALKFDFGGGGPRDLPWGKTMGDKAPGGNHFGTIASTTIPLPKGKWKFVTLSDDGVRVLVNSTPVIENWTWHAPERNEGIFENPGDASVEIVVEHFEIDGYAVLRLDIEPAL
jgi:hypothetical protein